MRRLLAVALLALAAAASAALPDALDALLRDLSTRSENYTAGRVGYDGELEGRMDALKAQLDALVAALPDSDRRKTRIAELAAQTRRLKLRFTTTGGIGYGQIGRELAAHVAAIRALDETVATVVAAGTVGADAERLARLKAQAAAAAALGNDILSNEAFALHDAVTASPSGLVRPALKPVQLVRPGTRVPSPAAAAPSSPTELKLRSRGPLVNKLQTELNLVRRALGLRIISVDGHFGPKTRAAVIAFQRGVGLPPTGIVDEATNIDLFRSAVAVQGREKVFVQIGDDGQGVSRIQDMINRIAGNRIVKADGDFGGDTQRAVRAFQRARKLPNHGHVDERTLAALEAAAKDKPPVGAVRRLVPPGPVPDLYTSPRMPADVSALIADAEKEFGITPGLLRALVWAEGGALGNSAVARGPAQITQSGSWGCRQLGYKWPQIRDQKLPNIRCGAYIFSHRPGELGAAPESSVFVSFAVYNTVAKHWPRIVRENKVPPFVETTSYVTRISRMYCQYTGIRLLVPNRDLYPNMLALSKRVDRDMATELALEGREPRPDCSPY